MTKLEKRWLFVVLFFYICYNLPFVPRYNSAVGAIIHGIITLIPLWISIYVGLFFIFKEKKLSEEDEEC